MRSEQTHEDRIEDMLDCIDSALCRLCVYAERQTELLERLVELNKPKTNGTPRKQFKPPTIKEVADYVKQINGSIDPSNFIDYYQARGWKLNNGTPVKDWMACVRTWERNGFNKPPVSATNENTGAVL